MCTEFFAGPVSIDAGCSMGCSAEQQNSKDSVFWQSIWEQQFLLFLLVWRGPGAASSSSLAGVAPWAATASGTRRTRLCDLYVPGAWD
eukprot:COSAG01_NODE_34_length_34978_cov_45.798475_10_plen_88_part_00